MHGILGVWRQWRDGAKVRERVAEGIAAAMLGVMVVPGVAVRVAQADSLIASFDWSMPARFGLDRNNDGVIDYVDGATDMVTGYNATPSSWHVDLDACASTAGSGATYQWTVLDQPDPATPITVQGGPGCADVSMDVPEEGTYRVQLTVDDAGATATLVRDVVVQDWLIVSVGDSYGAGEGAPDIPIDQSELYQADTAWQDVGDKLQTLVTIQTSMQPIQDNIAYWQDAIDRAGIYCNPSDPRADAGLCLQATGDVVWYSGAVIGSLAQYAANVVVETVQDAINLVGSLVNAAQQAWEAAVQLARSITGNVRATWEAQRCHRSANSGSAQAALQLEQADPHTSVTFVHLACSGATMTYGLLGAYEGAEHPDGVNNVACNSATPPAGCIPPQLQVAKQLIGNREVDAAYVSIGGNDAHFADIVIACIIQSNCGANNPISDPGQFLASFCGAIADVPFVNYLRAKCEDFFNGLPSLMDTAADLIEEGINGDVRPPIDPMFPGLSVGYGRLATQLVGTSGLLPAGRESRVFLSQYVDAVKRDDGVYCDFGTMGLSTIPGMSNIESSYVDHSVIPQLFGAIQQATVDHGWTYVDGIYAGFTNHGYCASDHYIVRAQETFLREGLYQGMVHPNTAGYSVYRDTIYPQWIAQLYPSGLTGEPRRPDQRPYADAGAATTVVEGSSATLTNGSWDSNGDPLTFAWSHDQPGKVSIAPVDGAAPTLTGIDDTTGTATVTVSDATGSRSDTAAFTVTNAPPVVDTITGLTSPVQMNSTVTATAAFTDPGVNDTHSVTWDWGDGNSSAGTITEANGSGIASGTHAYTATGIYTVSATVTDDDGASDTSTYQYAVVYDPGSGFVTGGGWFDSPSGAYTPEDSTDADIVGKAHFGFVSKYQKGATTPEGNTGFRLTAANLQFDSTSYDWMVISGSKATYKGLGTVNGTEGYAFMISAIDGGSGGVDKLRVRIWDKTSGVVLYDNQSGTALDGSPTTEIGAGAITVQGSK